MSRRRRELAPGELACLSLSAPLACLLVRGHVSFITRPFFTAHRGTVLIHAALRDCSGPQVRALARHKLGNALLPGGAIVGEAVLTDCGKPHDFQPPSPLQDWQAELLAAGGYVWRIGPVRAFMKGIAHEGGRRLYGVPPHIVSQGELALGLL